MSRGGTRPGAGRKKGSRNRRSADLFAKASVSGELPIDFMLEIMRDEKQPPERRDRMAIAAAPYLHARLSPVEVGDSGPEIDLTALSDEELETLYRLRLKVEGRVDGDGACRVPDAKDDEIEL